jgi:hypothetical protein
MMRSNRLSSGLLACLLLTGLARPARASATFPEALRSKLGLTQLAGPGPGCRLCHQTDVGGLKTATQPFGRSMLKAGATGGSVPSLLAALELLEAEGSDSDHDGTTDIAELDAGTNPNASDGDAQPSPAAQVPLPETGCGFPRSRSTSPPWVAVALAFGWLVRRSRRRG